jgi:hypothetical protein
MQALSRLFSRSRAAAAALGLPVALAALAAIQPSLAEAPIRRVFTDLFLWLVLAVPIAIAAVCARDWLRDIGFEKRERRWVWLILLASYVAGFVFVQTFFASEQDIKVYDSTAYWINVIADQRLISDSIPAYLLHLRDTFAREYNHLAALPLIPVSRWLGVTFTGYSLSVLYAYYLPACLFLSIFTLRLVRLARGEALPVRQFAVCFCLCALCVPLLWPVMNGYLDVVGVLLFAFLLNASLHWDCTRFSVKRNLALAAVSLLLVLCRRWYAFNVVGFYLAFAVVALPRAFSGQAARKLGSLVLNMAMIAGVCSLCFFLINPALFNLFLGNSYGTAYSAYKSMGMLRNLWEILTNMGLLWVVAALVGLRIALRKDAARPLAVRLLIIAAVSYVLFSRIQHMGFHQAYLLLPTLLIFAGTAVVFFISFAPAAWRTPLAAFLLVAISFNFLNGYEPRLKTAAYTTQPLTTAMRRYPQTNPDYELIRQVVDDLTERTQGTSRHIYVIGDGSSLSPEILKRSLLPEQTDAAPAVLVNNITDLRDGFPSQLFLADYVLLRDPFVTEFAAPQQVSVQASDLFLNDPATESHYRRVRDYTASDGAIVLFEKLNPVDTRFVDNLRDRLLQFYPDTPFVYEPDYFIALCRIDPDTPYTYNPWDDNALTFPKTAGEPITIGLGGLAGQSTLSFELSCWEEGLEIAVRNQNGEIRRQPVARAERVPYRIDVDGSDFLVIAVAESAAAPVAGGVIMYRPELH